MTEKHAQTKNILSLDTNKIREAVQGEYAEVALEPDKGFHFHIGRKLLNMLDYEQDWMAGLPESAVESFAGTGNPFSLGEIAPGEHVVDIGSGAGLDSLIAARMAGEDGQVVGIDMTQAMLDKARRNADQVGLENITFRQGYAEELPVEDGWADVVISNGVLNLMPDKQAGLGEMHRVLNDTGRLQLGDILVKKEVPHSAKEDIELWSG